MHEDELAARVGEQLRDPRDELSIVATDAAHGLVEDDAGEEDPRGILHVSSSQTSSISLALRSHSACQRRAAWADDLLLWLHNRGWYKKGNCVCHAAEASVKSGAPIDAPGGGGVGTGSDAVAHGGLSDDVVALLRAAGVDERRAMAGAEEDDEEQTPEVAQGASSR